MLLKIQAGRAWFLRILTGSGMLIVPRGGALMFGELYIYSECIRTPHPCCKA